MLYGLQGRLVAGGGLRGRLRFLFRFRRRGRGSWVWFRGGGDGAEADAPVRRRRSRRCLRRRFGGRLLASRFVRVRVSLLS